jgi:hypothetical protein
MKRGDVCPPSINDVRHPSSKNGLELSFEITEQVRRTCTTPCVEEIADAKIATPISITYQQ